MHFNPKLFKVSIIQTKLFGTFDFELSRFHCILTLTNLTLRKHAYSNILKILQPKKENFQIKNFDIFHIPAQNIGCGYALEPPRFGETGICKQRRSR